MSDYKDTIDILLLGITCDDIPDFCHFKEDGFVDPNFLDEDLDLEYATTSRIDHVGMGRAERGAFGYDMTRVVEGLMDEFEIEGAEDEEQPEMPGYDKISHIYSPHQATDRHYSNLLNFNGHHLHLDIPPPLPSPDLLPENWEEISDESTDTWSTDVQIEIETLGDRVWGVVRAWWGRGLQKGVGWRKRGVGLGLGIEGVV